MPDSSDKLDTVKFWSETEAGCPYAYCQRREAVMAELLAACKGLLVCAMLPMTFQVWRALVEHAVAAIAKAEGTP